MEKLERIAKYAARFLLREGSLELSANERDAEFLRALRAQRTIRKVKEIAAASGIMGNSSKYRQVAKFGSLRAIAAPKVVFPSEDVKSSGCISSTL